MIGGGLASSQRQGRVRRYRRRVDSGRLTIDTEFAPRNSTHMTRSSIAWATAATLWISVAVALSLSSCAGEEGVHCATNSEGCSCFSGDDPNTFECSEAAFPKTACCARSGWPGAGSSCQCAAPVGCENLGGVCWCGEGYRGDLASCPQPKQAGACCTSELRHTDGSTTTRCVCRDTSACLTGEETVSSCIASEYISPCGSDPNLTEVASCSDGSGTSQAATGSTGTGGLCTPIGGECEDSGDCTCGGACLATSNCSSCSMYCVFPCNNDADCVDMSKNFTSKFTHCKSGDLFTYCE